MHTSCTASQRSLLCANSVRVLGCVWRGRGAAFTIPSLHWGGRVTILCLLLPVPIAAVAVLMAMGSILWEQGAYSALEQLFRQSAEFCSEHDTWKLNVAHTFFMQVR